jgi:hypothetical protein
MILAVVLGKGTTATIVLTLYPSGPLRLINWGAWKPGFHVNSINQAGEF